MPGKRKRSEPTKSDAPVSTSGSSIRKPISAIAAAKLKAGIAAPMDGAQEETITSPLIESDESAYEESEPEEETPIIHRNFKLCTWQDDGNNVLSDSNEELTIVLNKHSTIALIGCYDFKVLKGAVNINGANFGAVPRHGETARIYRAFVPSTGPISKIRGLDNSNQIQFLHCKERVPFANISPLFANIWNAKSSKGHIRSFDIVTESDSDPLQRSLIPEQTPEDWIRTVEECTTTPSIILITGAQSSGKSIFAKRLMNRYLTGLGRTSQAVPSVCYLDLDPAKPEYTPHGQMSLLHIREANLGPSFTHPTPIPGTVGMNALVQAHVFPTRGIANYQTHFNECIEDFFHTYRTLQQRQTSLPLIINTPNFLYTSYFETLLQLLSRFKPRHLVHLGDIQSIDQDTAIKLDAIQNTASKFQTAVHEISSQATFNVPSRIDAEMRDMHMISYFHYNGLGKTSSASDIQQRQNVWNSNPLSHMSPWEFCYEETETRKQDFVGFLMMSEPVEPAHLFTALNGSIIQILTSSVSMQRTVSRTTKFCIPYFEKTEAGIVEPLAPRFETLICTALIRGFDPERRIVQVLVPRTHEALLHGLSPERTILIGGCCDTPEWAYTEEAYYQATPESVNKDTEAQPWVAKKEAVAGIGYLNTVRRVRKFQQ